MDVLASSMDASGSPCCSQPDRSKGKHSLCFLLLVDPYAFNTVLLVVDTLVRSTFVSRAVHGSQENPCLV